MKEVNNTGFLVWMALIVLASLQATPVSAVLGDLNRDGRVDIDDFFLFAANFGRIGSPEPATSLRFDGAYWRVDSEAESPGIEWLRFTDGGIVQRLRTDVFSPGALEANLSQSDSTVRAPRAYVQRDSDVSFGFYETLTGTLVYVTYRLEFATGDRLVSSRNGHQYDFMAFRETIPSAEFFLAGSITPDTVETVVRDTIELVVRDTIRVPDTPSRLNDGLRDDWVTYLYQFSTPGPYLFDWVTSPNVRSSCCLGSVILNGDGIRAQGKFGPNTVYVGPIDISVETEWVSGPERITSSWSSYGIKYYVDPQAPKQYYRFGIDLFNFFVVSKVSPLSDGYGVVENLVSGQNAIEGKGRNTLRVTADNGLHQFFINNVKVAEITDPDIHLSRGRVEVYVNINTVEFDNLRIGVTPFGN
ncbi:MAG: hypothetical protein HOG99_13665 [Gemmatimonadetes bacterium]|jgi:hypothetical protein|nr:hypothetical protein [Gemmatimonadota bacterium]MBT5962588.1 hypothetical protein [Gemmatimonadota bacterium]MBT6627524.1 hypothetical protein [Gemmatimonadota bacterium]MBT7453265.1 hypothetical protein [Gemmatimonadota bacterium]